MTVNKDIDNGKAFDWGQTSSDYAKYRDIYPEEFYGRIADLNLCTKGQYVLDIGTGTGVLPRNMYKYGAKFMGADISENQIEYAKKLSAGMNIEYAALPAEELDFEETFDVVTACQCFMYFDKSIIPKIHKWLKPGGHLLILFMAWLPYESEIAMRSEELIKKYNPDWSGAGMKRYAPKSPKGTDGLFETANLIAYDINVPFTREAWHGRMKACRGMGASSLTDGEKAAWEEEHLKYIDTLPEVFDILHYATMTDLKKT